MLEMPFKLDLDGTDFGNKAQHDYGRLENDFEQDPKTGATTEGSSMGPMIYSRQSVVIKQEVQ
jgi:hypothetical protein